MAAEDLGGVDFKALEAAKKEAQKNMQKYKVWSKYTKVNKKHKKHKACAKTLASGNNPLIKAMEKCGYHDVVFHHTPTGVAQAGSYRAAWKDQLTVSADEFDICVPDIEGFLLDAANENCMAGCSNMQTLELLRNIAKDAELRKTTLKMAWGGYGWKVIKKEERKSDGGAILIGLTTKLSPLLKDNYFKLYDNWENMCDYWQLYKDGEAVENEFTYCPKDCFDVEVGGKYTVMTSRKEFDALGLSSHTPFTTQEEWDAMCRNTLGWDCEVTGFNDAGDGWVGYNVSIEVTHSDGNKVSAVVPVRALRRKDAGDTAIFLAEVGQFVFKAEMDLFENKGHVERGKQMQPLVAEWTSIAYHFGSDEHGFADFLDYDEEENEGCWDQWKPEIQAWLTERENAGEEYGDLGFGME